MPGYHPVNSWCRSEPVLIAWMKLDVKLNTVGEGNLNRRGVIAVPVRLVEDARIPSGKLVVQIGTSTDRLDETRREAEHCWRGQPEPSRGHRCTRPTRRRCQDTIR